MRLGSSRTPALPEQGRHWGAQGGEGGVRQGQGPSPYAQHRLSIAKALRTNAENSVKAGGLCVPPPESDLGEQV